MMMTEMMKILNIENIPVDKIANMVLDTLEKNKKYEIKMMLTIDQLQQLIFFLKKFDKAQGFEEGK